MILIGVKYRIKAFFNVQFIMQFLIKKQYKY
jgi:hypothetical protein